MNKENPTTHQINTKKFPSFTRSNNGKQVYCEYDGGIWYKWEYDDNGNEIYYENSDGYWAKNEYDDNGNKIYLENSDGDWYKREYDDNRNEIYYENSDGTVIDKRPKSIPEYTMEELVIKLGHNFKIKK